MTTMTVNGDRTVDATEAYPKMEKLLWNLVHQYQRSFGGDLEELISQARLCFTEAVTTWDPHKGALITHVYNRVYYGLRTHARALYKQGGFAKTTPTADPLTVQAKTSFDWQGFLGEVSDQAKEVAQVAVDLSAGGKPAKPEAVAALLAEAGWAAAEILKCFRELRDALS